jgi:FHS family L-fucose permease-like MFS transporter
MNWQRLSSALRLQPSQTQTLATSPTLATRSPRTAFAVVTAQFFMWGFLTCLNDIMIPHLKGIFELNYAQAMMVQFCFFSAYFVVSIPAGRLIDRLGYKTGMILGLAVAALGTLLFQPAATFGNFSWFLAGFFILASGITILQVAANPYVSVLGAPERASSRLNLSQAFNSLGTTLAPLFSI